MRGPSRAGALWSALLCFRFDWCARRSGAYRRYPRIVLVAWRPVEQFCGTRSVGVGDVVRHNAPGRPGHGDIVGVAETDDDIRNEVCRHDEIRECGYDSGLYTIGVFGPWAQQ